VLDLKEGVSFVYLFFQNKTLRNQYLQVIWKIVSLSNAKLQNIKAIILLIICTNGNNKKIVKILLNYKI